jgi:hypothetical protein
MAESLSELFERAKTVLIKSQKTYTTVDEYFEGVSNNSVYSELQNYLYGRNRILFERMSEMYKILWDIHNGTLKELPKPSSIHSTAYNPYHSNNDTHITNNSYINVSAFVLPADTVINYTYFLKRVENLERVNQQVEDAYNIIINPPSSGGRFFNIFRKKGTPIRKTKRTKRIKHSKRSKKSQKSQSIKRLHRRM